MDNRPSDCLDILVIGAGQAGLAMAYYLSEQRVRFLVVDAALEIGHSWRARWDSLRLFSPAQYDGLPGMAFPAPEDTYPTKDQVAAYLQAYAERFSFPVLLGCSVSRVQWLGDRFAIHTSEGFLSARQVVIATGAFQRPVVPGFAAALSPQVVQLHSSDYRRPSDVPSGHVVVVGAGNSGRQIAEELARTHEVTLAVGRRTLQLPQRVLGKDLFWWLTRLGVITKWVESGLARRMRTRGELIIGTPLSRLERAGVRICRRVVDVTHEQVVFEVGSVDRPSAVVWATGFHSDHSWIDIPELIADDGSVRHERGITAVPGLAFLGLSALLGFIKTDAAWVARQLEAQRRLGPASSAATTKNRITG